MSTARNAPAGTRPALGVPLSFHAAPPTNGLAKAQRYPMVNTAADIRWTSSRAAIIGGRASVQIRMKADAKPIKQIGRASCRERVGQYGKSPGGAVLLTKKQKNTR